MRQAPQRIGDMRPGPRHAAGSRDDRLDRQRIVLCPVPPPPRASWQAAAAGAGIRPESFACFMPTSRCTGRSAQEPRCSASTDAGAGIMAAVEPQLPVRTAAERRGGPCRRCSRAGHSAAADAGGAMAACRGWARLRRLQGGDGDAGVVQLERARQATAAAGRACRARLRSESRAARRQPHQSRSRSCTGAPPSRRLRQQTPAATSAGCAPIATGTPGFMIPAFSAAISRQACRPAIRDGPARSR